jgi:hypothetical protein
MSPTAQVEPTTPAPPLPTIHEAERASGTSGAVLVGREIGFAAAVLRRNAGEDVIIRGDDRKANRRLAEQIESAVGLAERQDPHQKSGTSGLASLSAATDSARRPHFLRDR